MWMSVCWWCIHACGTRLSQLVEQPELAEVIKEDAAAVEERQATDSVPLVDEIRFHIASNVQTYSEIEEANQKLEALEELLASINLCCWGGCRSWLTSAGYPSWRTACGVADISERKREENMSVCLLVLVFFCRFCREYISVLVVFMLHGCANMLLPC